MSATAIDSYVFEVLMKDLVGHDGKPSAFLVLLFIWHRGAKARVVELSLSEISEETGLSKSAVQSAIRVLKRRRLIVQIRKNATAIPLYEIQRPWRR